MVFIDTEGTFRPQRIVAIAERFGVEPTAVLDNITYARAYTHEHQMELLGAVAAKMTEEHYSLVVRAELRDTITLGLIRSLDRLWIRPRLYSAWISWVAESSLIVNK